SPRARAGLRVVSDIYGDRQCVRGLRDGARGALFGRIDSGIVGPGQDDAEGLGVLAFEVISLDLDGDGLRQGCTARAGAEQHLEVVLTQVVVTCLGRAVLRTV